MARKKQEPQEEPEAITQYRENIRNKSVRQLVKEAHSAVEEEDKQEEIKEAVVEQPEKKEEPEVKPTPEQTHEKELEEFKKTAKEAAKEAAAEESKALKEEIQKIRESDLTAKEKKEEIKKAKATWTGFDKTSGIPTPKDYDEIVSEAVRLAKEESYALYQEEIKKLRDEFKKTQEDEVKAKEVQEKEYQDRLAEINKRSASQIQELITLGKIKAPKAQTYDANDPAQQVIDDIYKQAAEENLKRKEEGKELITDLAKFYFVGYKTPESKQPAGADAPIAGTKAETPENTQRFNYVRDIRKPSFRQILRNGIKRS